MNPYSPIKTRNQRKTAAQAQRRADPARRILEQSADTERRGLARRTDPARRSLEQSVDSEQRALAREDPAVQARVSAQQAVAREDPVARSLEQSVDSDKIGCSVSSAWLIW